MGIAIRPQLSTSTCRLKAEGVVPIQGINRFWRDSEKAHVPTEGGYVPNEGMNTEICLIVLQKMEHQTVNNRGYRANLGDTNDPKLRCVRAQIGVTPYQPADVIEPMDGAYRTNTGVLCLCNPLSTNSFSLSLL